MLTFFRKIRKGLLGSGQAQRYLLYAIGEITLVVMGILIALQIDNWNDDRLKQFDILTSLNQLQNDLKEQLSEVDQDLGFHRNALISAYIILQHINSDENFHDSLGYHMRNITLDSYTHNFNTTYSEEKFKDLKNDRLRLKIQYLYEHSIPRVEKGSSSMPDMRDYWKNYGSDNFISQLKKPLDFNSLEIFINDAIESRDLRSIWYFQHYKAGEDAALKTDHRFMWLLQNTISFRAFHILRLEEARDQIQETLQLIKDELQNSDHHQEHQ